MNFDFDKLRPFFAKLVAPIIGGLISIFLLWLKAKTGIAVDLSNAELSEIVNQTIDMILYGIPVGIAAVKINKTVNPANAASTELAVAGKEIHEDEKRLQRITKEFAARQAGSE